MYYIIDDNLHIVFYAVHTSAGEVWLRPHYVNPRHICLSLSGCHCKGSFVMSLNRCSQVKENHGEWHYI